MCCNNIRKYRKEMKMTLQELSKLTGLSLGYISHLERGTRNNPSYETMKTISIALEKSIYTVFK